MKTASVAYSEVVWQTGQTLKLEKGQGKREGDWGEKIREVSAGSSGLVYS